MHDACSSSHRNIPNAGISARQLRSRYVVGLSLIAILTILSNAWMQFLIAAQEHDSRVVNIAGRQRMLSQRITKTGLMLAEGGPAETAARQREELSVALALWQQSHAGLQQGSTALELPGKNSPEVSVLFAAIEPDFQAMLAAGATLRQATDAATIFGAVRELRAHEPAFLKGMDAIVFRYDQEAKDKVVVSRWIEMGLMGVTLVVLACEALFIFAPATRRIAGDMRELLAREEALAQKVAELERTRDELVRSEKMASIGRLVAGFAHELNTPIGVAVGAASHMEGAVAAIDALMQRDEVSEADLNTELASIKEAAGLTLSNLRRAAQLMRSFKRTSIDQSSDACRDYRLDEVIGDVVLSLRGQFKRTRIRIDVDCDVRQGLRGHAGAIEQILANLLMNSYHHAYDDGAADGVISIRARATSAGMIELSYADDGAGMTAETLARVFEPFFTTRRSQGGSGLGMYVTYSLVTENLQGEISCASAPGAGTRVTIRFPGHAPPDPTQGTAERERERT